MATIRLPCLENKLASELCIHCELTHSTYVDLFFDCKFRADFVCIRELSGQRLKEKRREIEQKVK